LIFILFTLPLFSVSAQVNNDSLPPVKSGYPETVEGVKFSYQQLIVPSTLIALGVYGTINGSIDKEVRDKIDSDGDKTSIDNVLPFVAPASVYILNWCGVKGKHNFIDRSVILGTSAVLALGPTYLMKSTISTPRPDGSGDDSFPSFHTAAAFVGAEFMRQEYKDESVWYGVAGYGIATCTGLLRIYNNKHWLSDVLAGAGFGILGTKAAYWLYPEIRKLYEGTKLDHAIIVPYGSNQGFGLSISATF
jgi:hypothetical protein